MCLDLDGGDLLECAICAACCYCCFKALDGNSSSNRNRNEPQTVIVQHQPAPSGYPHYGTGAQPYYPGPQGQQQPGGYYPYPPQPGPGYYPPGNNGQAYPYPPTHNAPPYASAPPPYDPSRY